MPQVPSFRSDWFRDVLVPQPDYVFRQCRLHLNRKLIHQHLYRFLTRLLRRITVQTVYDEIESFPHRACALRVPPAILNVFVKIMNFSIAKRLVLDSLLSCQRTNHIYHPLIFAPVCQSSLNNQKFPSSITGSHIYIHIRLVVEVIGLFLPPTPIYVIFCMIMTLMNNFLLLALINVFEMIFGAFKRRYK